MPSITVHLSQETHRAFRHLAIDRGVSNARLIELLVAEATQPPAAFAAQDVTTKGTLATSPKLVWVEHTAERDALSREWHADPTPERQQEIAELLHATLTDEERDPTASEYMFPCPQDVVPRRVRVITRGEAQTTPEMLACLAAAQQGLPAIAGVDFGVDMSATVVLPPHPGSQEDRTREGSEAPESVETPASEPADDVLDVFGDLS